MNSQILIRGVVAFLPGLLCVYAALWVLVAFGAGPGMMPLAVGAAILSLATIADYVFPAIFAQKFKCAKMGVFGCFVGTIAGLFFLPLGIVFGPFLGTVCGELVVGRTVGAMQNRASKYRLRFNRNLTVIYLQLLTIRKLTWGNPKMKKMIADASAKTSGAEIA